MAFFIPRDARDALTNGRNSKILSIILEKSTVAGWSDVLDYVDYPPYRRVNLRLDY